MAALAAEPGPRRMAHRRPWCGLGSLVRGGGEGLRGSGVDEWWCWPRITEVARRGWIRGVACRPLNLPPVVVSTPCQRGPRLPTPSRAVRWQPGRAGFKSDMQHLHATPSCALLPRGLARGWSLPHASVGLGSGFAPADASSPSSTTTDEEARCGEPLPPGCPRVQHHPTL